MLLSSSSGFKHSVHMPHFTTSEHKDITICCDQQNSTAMLLVQVEVEHEIDGWLQVANIHGEVGLVPSSFVRILQPGEASPAAVGAAGAALSSAVSTGFEGLPGIVSNCHGRVHHALGFIYPGRAAELPSLVLCPLWL